MFTGINLFFPNPANHFKPRYYPMKKLILLSLLITAFAGLGSCQKESIQTDPKPINLDLKSKAIIEADNAFAFEVFREILQSEEDNKNLMISPLSISLALAMTYNGADGDTKEAMEEVFHLHGLSPDDINKSYQGLINTLLNIDSKVIMEIANSIWYRNTFKVEDSFLNVNKEYFDAEVEGLDFTNASSKDIINQWVSSSTHNKIEKIINKIEPADVMFLINAIYFKGTWKYQFEEKNTHDSPFYSEANDYLKDVKMMNIKGDFNTLSNDLFEAVELPYGQGNYSMLVLMPHAGASISDLVNEMNHDKWKLWMNSFQERSDFSIYLPRFKFEYEKELKEALTNLGMGVAFSNMADFSKINPNADLLISSVKHKTFVEVNEEGTEAAAVTSVTISLTSIGPVNEFRADHPFIFIIKEKYTNAIMFMGKVANPETE